MTGMKEAAGRKRSAKVGIVGVFLLQAAFRPCQAMAQEIPSDVIAVVLGEEIHRATEIEGQELLGIVLLPLLERYVAEREMEPTEEEIDSLEEALSSPDVDEAERPERREIARQIVTSFKISRSLYQEYGGRVVFQQAGPWPVDAYRAFLEERQEAGDFQILDPELVEGFWDYLVDDTKHSFYPPDEAEQVVSTPWWLRETPEAQP